ncbi:hypothetical protein B8W95_14205, partial [Staphylococcus pasteuri]
LTGQNRPSRRGAGSRSDFESAASVRVLVAVIVVKVPAIVTRVRNRRFPVYGNSGRFWNGRAVQESGG